MILLYDGLLERIAQLKGAIEQNNIELRHRKVNQATGIVLGLREALNVDATTDLAGGLDSLYDYVQRQLWAANVNSAPALLDECTELVLEVSTAWREIAPSVY